MAVQLFNFRIPATDLRQVASSVASVVGIGSVVAATFAVTHWTGRSAIEPDRGSIVLPYSASPPGETWATPSLTKNDWEGELTIYIVSGTDHALFLEAELLRMSNIRAAAGEPPVYFEVVVLAGDAEQAAFDEGHLIALQVRFANDLPPMHVVDLR